MNFGRKYEGINRHIHTYIELDLQYNIQIAFSFTSKLNICFSK